MRFMYDVQVDRRVLPEGQIVIAVADIKANDLQIPYPLQEGVVVVLGVLAESHWLVLSGSPVTGGDYA